jgi:hypothetical protein
LTIFLKKSSLIDLGQRNNNGDPEGELGEEKYDIQRYGQTPKPSLHSKERAKA